MAEKTVTLSEKTRVPLSFIVAGIVAITPAITGFIWMAVTVNDILTTLESMGQDISEIRNDGTTRASVQAWVRELKALNPTLVVPELVE